MSSSGTATGLGAVMPAKGPVSSRELHVAPIANARREGCYLVAAFRAQLERRALYRGVFTSVSELKVELENFIKAHNAESAKPFKWTKPASKILASVERAKQSLHN